MRIKASASFPHPVLAAATSDYGDRLFQISLSVDEDPASAYAVLTGSLSLDDPSVLALLEEGSAASGLMVTCQDTYLDRFFSCAPGDVRIDLSGGQLRGPVLVRGTVLAIKDRVPLRSQWIDAEFPDEARTVGAGEIIALTEELKFEAGLEKLAPLESIFHLKLLDEVPEGIFRVALEDEAIDILVAPALHGALSLMRQQDWRDTLLSALFLPVVMTVLEAMKQEDSYYADKRWYGVMSARCNAEGIDITRCDSSEAAQKLLDSPLGSLQKVFERFSG